MTRSTFKILFYIKRTRKNSDGSTPIYMRITVNGSRCDCAVHENTDTTIWDSIRGRVTGMTKNASMINSHLDCLQAKAYSIKRELEEKNKVVTAKAVRNLFLGIDEDRKTLLGVFGEHNERCRQLLGKDFAAGTIERYETVYRLLQLFMQSKYNKKDMSLDEINYKFIMDFELFLKVNRNCCHNTATKYLKNFKKITREALANNWMTLDPFAQIRFHLDEVDVSWLEKDELEKLMNMRFENARLALVKDMFIFCCFTGLAFIDAKNLTYTKVTEKGIDWNICARRKKSTTKFYVPLLEPAVKIIDKYRTHPVCVETGRVLPMPSNQKMNAYLKEIADIAGINKRLTTHCGRHTFASTVTLANGISRDLIKDMMGQKSTIMTRIYSKFEEKAVKKEMDRVAQNYKTPTFQFDFYRPCNN